MDSDFITDEKRWSEQSKQDFTNWQFIVSVLNFSLHEACLGPTRDITQYQIRFQSGPVVATENVNIPTCTAGRCSHTFEPPSNPPSSYDSVSVAAENVVGVGAARNCTTQTISELPVLCY